MRKQLFNSVIEEYLRSNHDISFNLISLYHFVKVLDKAYLLRVATKYDRFLLGKCPSFKN